MADEIELIECGCCGGWHKKGYAGDCRNDAERYVDPDRRITAEFICKVNKGLTGLYNLAPVATEPYFSACGCDCCGSELAGDRFEITATRGKKHTDPREPLLICVDCYLYLMF